jgi:hypothetical protein
MARPAADRVDGPSRLAGNKSRASPFKLLSFMSRTSRPSRTQKSAKNEYGTKRTVQATLSSAPCLYTYGDTIDGIMHKGDSYESFETTTTDSEFYRDWRHSIDFGTSTVLNKFTATNDQALQTAYDQTHSSVQVLPVLDQPALTDQNATELIYTAKNTSRTAHMRNSIFERFIRRPLVPTTKTTTSASTNGMTREWADNELNKHRALLTSTPRNHNNRTGALDTNMNVLYI